MWIFIWKHPARLFPHALVCLTCRWVRWGRGVQGRDKEGAGVQSCKVMDGGGRSSSAFWRRSTGVITWGIPLLLGMVQSFNSFYHCSLLSLIFLMDLIFSEFGSAEESECAERGGTASRNGGPGEDRGGSGRFRGGRSVWALEGSHITFSYVLHCTPTKNAATPQPPSYPNYPLRSQKLYLKLLLLWLKKPNWHWKFSPQLYHKLWMWLSLPTWHPFAYSWGHQESL